MTPGCMRLSNLTPPRVVSSGPVHDRVVKGNEARRRHAADQPPLREGRRPLHRLRHPGVQGSRHRRAQPELSAPSAQRPEPLRRQPAFARPHLGASAALRGAQAESRSRDRHRRASGDQPGRRRQGRDGGRRVRCRRRAAGPAGRSRQMPDHRRRSAGGGRVRAGRRNPRRRPRGRRAVRRIHRLFDRPLDPQRVRRQGDHLAPQSDLPRHHSRVTRPSTCCSAAPPRRRMCTCASRKWCRISRR